MESSGICACGRENSNDGKGWLTRFDFSLALEELVWRFLFGMLRPFPVLMTYCI